MQMREDADPKLAALSPALLAELRSFLADLHTVDSSGRSIFMLAGPDSQAEALAASIDTVVAELPTLFATRRGARPVWPVASLCLPGHGCWRRAHPHQRVSHPVNILTTRPEIAQWNADSLPDDRVHHCGEHGVLAAADWPATAGHALGA